MAGLPEDFKQRFPSLNNIYGDLSSAIHRADPNDELFNGTKEKIIEHFKAKDLFKLAN